MSPSEPILAIQRREGGFLMGTHKQVSQKVVGSYRPSLPAEVRENNPNLRHFTKIFLLGKIN